MRQRLLATRTCVTRCVCYYSQQSKQRLNGRRTFAAARDFFSSTYTKRCKMDFCRHNPAATASPIGATSLSSLPTELIHQIATYIPVSGLIALKLTSKQLFFQLPSPPQDYIKTTSECEKRAIRRYVAERCNNLGGRRKCILCSALMPTELYCGRSEPVCKWHQGWFERVLVVDGLPERYDDDTLDRQTRMKTLCGHCKQIRGWNVERCECESSGGCESCGSWEVECRVRLVSAKG